MVKSSSSGYSLLVNVSGVPQRGQNVRQAPLEDSYEAGVPALNRNDDR